MIVVGSLVRYVVGVWHSVRCGCAVVVSVCGSLTGCVLRWMVVDRVCDARSRVWLVRGRTRRVEVVRAMRRVLEGIIASLGALFRWVVCMVAHCGDEFVR